MLTWCETDCRVAPNSRVTQGEKGSKVEGINMLHELFIHDHSPRDIDFNTHAHTFWVLVMEGLLCSRDKSDLIHRKCLRQSRGGTRKEKEVKERREGMEENPVWRAKALAAVGIKHRPSSSPSIQHLLFSLFSQSESVDSQLSCPLNRSLMSSGFIFHIKNKDEEEEKERACVFVLMLCNRLFVWTWGCYL